MNFRSMMKSKKGFTLVELMVVVVILGILVGIAVPAYNAVTKNAEKKACHSTCKILEKAATQYLANTDSETVAGIAATEGAFDSKDKTIELASKADFTTKLSEEYRKNIEEPIDFFDNGCSYTITYLEGGRTIHVYCTRTDGRAHGDTKGAQFTP